MGRRHTLGFSMAVMLALLAGCKDDKTAQGAAAPVEVGVFTVSLRDTPVVFDFVGQTQSSQQVEIRARVNGFLEQRIYTEGSMVHAGDVLFLMDKKPFEAALDAARAAYRQQQARYDTAVADLKRVRPLAAKNALSQKDLDDSVGQEQAAAAALEQARADVTSAELNLGYTTITSPVTGQSSFAKKQQGSYIDASNSLLTYVAKLDRIWVNFSLSENELLRLRAQTSDGSLKMPGKGLLQVEIVLADGSIFPERGRIAFTDASLNQETGTYLVRAEFPNADGVLRPGQFVRVKLRGALRAHAIAVPQTAVLQGERGAFVWTVDKDGKAQQRPVEAGEWSGNDWIIRSGLHAGDQVVTDNVIRLAPGLALKTHPAQLKAEPVASRTAPPTLRTTAAAAGSAAPATVGSTAGANRTEAPGTAPAAHAEQATVLFEVGSAQISVEAAARLAPIAARWHEAPQGRAVVAGYADASGSHDANLALSAARAKAVRAALIVAGIPADRIELRPPANVIAGSTGDARRVDIRFTGDANGAAR
ncbi:efflux RND transporter periplasmic adaptor subunit [Dyella soli]|uniref:Efflux RND transporter periplasmic adaptor subunit n=1 Tax=Dyella soli TaxID=522319 RepID=A0A4R0YN91_9GAMM|nr:efflux RND transporter periplasmic adaptor subunit [Dyella soli]TCI10236.1 efflux RND transporter periplasmic adaptor subunit [Dyella soli]